MVAQGRRPRTCTRGTGVPQNLTEALRWPRKAHAQALSGGCDRTGAADATPTAAGSGRSGVAITKPQSASSSLFLPPSPIPIGTRVELHGLKAKPELNRAAGRRGGVRRRLRAVQSEAGGRALVGFKSKAENLKSDGDDDDQLEEEKRGGQVMRRKRERERRTRERPSRWGRVAGELCWRCFLMSMV